MIKVLLWDVDNTLLSFEAAERVAIRKGFDRRGLGECTDDMLQRYSAINRSYWERLERGEITKPQVLLGRFEEFFRQEGIPVSLAEAFNEDYQRDLGETCVFMDRSFELLSQLKAEGYEQYAVTNGTKVAQDKKLGISGLGALMNGIFISEVVGAEKPSPLFFDYIFRALPHVFRKECMIIGDSLTSDMKGGEQAGITTCWYNPAHKPNQAGVSVDHEIENLWQVRDLL